MFEPEFKGLRSVVDSNIEDGAVVEAEASAPYRGLLERHRNLAKGALSGNRPSFRIHDTQRAVKWLDGRGSEAGSSPGGMLTWYALAALHRFHLERPATPSPLKSDLDKLRPGRADLEFLSLSLHLHHQGRLHRLYTIDNDLRAAAQHMRVPAQATLAPTDKRRMKPPAVADYSRPEWSPDGWIARESEILCNLTGHLTPMRGDQSFYSFEVLCDFYALDEAARRQRIGLRGIVRADLLDLLEVVRSSSWRGEERVALSALEMVLNPGPISVKAGSLWPQDYGLAANVLGVESNQYRGKPNPPDFPLPASDVLILAAAINRSVAAHLHGDNSTIRVHYRSGRVRRIREFLAGEALGYVRGVVTVGDKDLSTAPALLQAVRRIQFLVGP
jgi:hypothetical protein